MSTFSRAGMTCFCNALHAVALLAVSTRSSVRSRSRPKPLSENLRNMTTFGGGATVPSAPATYCLLIPLCPVEASAQRTSPSLQDHIGNKEIRDPSAPASGYLDVYLKTYPQSVCLQSSKLDGCIVARTTTRTGRLESRLKR